MAVPETLNADSSKALTVYDNQSRHWITVFVQRDEDTGTDDLYYDVHGTYESFDPEDAQLVTVQILSSNGKYVVTPYYFVGIPESIRMNQGRIEVYVTNLTGEKEDPSNRIPGEMLLGTFRADADPSSGDWIKWTCVSANSGYIRAATPVLPVCGSASVNPVHPIGVTCVEYERDDEGSVVTGENGEPKIALIDEASGDIASNYKVGQLVLAFRQDYFGSGKHAWVGGETAGGHEPFDIILTGGEISIWPGTVNGYLPSNIFDTFPYDMESKPTVYVKLVASTDGYGLVNAQIVVDSNPPDINYPEENFAPTSFNVLIGIVADAIVYKTWGGGNMRAVTSQAIIQEKEAPEPGSSPYIYWWKWDISVES